MSGRSECARAGGWVWVWVVALAGAAAWAPAGGAGPIVFTKIADTSTALPGGTGTFLSVSAPAVSGSNVAFVMSQNPGKTSGVYLSTDGVLSRVADTTMTAPNGARYTSFVSVSLDGTNIAFRGNGFVGTEYVMGIFKRVNGVTTRVVDTTQSIPVTGQFEGFSKPVIVGEDVYVYSNGRQVRHESIVTDAGGSVHSLVNSTASPPSSTDTFWSLNCNVGVAATGGDVAFFGVTGVPRGIYRLSGGTLARIADLTTVLPGGRTAGVFSNLGIQIDGQRTGFMASINEQWSVYAESGGVISRLFRSGDQIGAVSERVNDSCAFVLDHGHLAFSTLGGDIISDFGGESLERVIGKGDTLSGKTVAWAGMGLEGLDGNSLGFAVGFTDGSSGVYLAQVPAAPNAAPLPPTVVAGAVGAAGVVVGRWRRAGRASAR